MEQIEACGVLCTLGPRTLTRDVEERKGEQTHRQGGVKSGSGGVP